VLACRKVLEDAAVGLIHGKSFSQRIADLGGGTWQGILTLTVLLFVVLIPPFAFGELQRAVGEGKLAQLLSAGVRCQNLNQELSNLAEKTRPMASMSAR